MADFPMPAVLLELITERFKVLAEPARLLILNALRERERTVSELVDELGLGQANVSKHLQFLHGQGFVGRRKEGLYVYYRLADEEVLTLCDIMCERLMKGDGKRERLLGPDAQP